jgi:hypothetical protein
LGGTEIGESGVVCCIDPTKAGFQKPQPREFPMLIGTAHQDRYEPVVRENEATLLVMIRPNPDGHGRQVHATPSASPLR